MSACACNADVDAFVDGLVDVLGGEESAGRPEASAGRPEASAGRPEASAGRPEAAGFDDFVEAGRASFDDGESHAKALAATSVKGTSGDADAALDRVGTTTSECSETTASGPGQPCSSRRVLEALGEFVSDTNRPGADATPLDSIKKAAQALGCESESCVVAHPRFASFVESSGALDDVGGTGLLEVELARRFKTAGPRNSTRLLSNFNIDGVLQEWAAKFPKFFNYPFCMMDFASQGGSLAVVPARAVARGLATQSLGPRGGPVRRACDTFACVLNTDVSTGRGKHWVAVFGDCRGGDGVPWTIEYFNSAGNPPTPEATRWMEETAADLAEFRASGASDGPVLATPLTDVRHQDSQTECGLYSLYFIRRRLEGAPLDEFRGTRIPDEAMVRFREHVFRDAGDH